MLSFMSDRRVLAASAACITAAIFLFLLGTFPSWKAALGGGWWWDSEPTTEPAGTAAPRPVAQAPIGAPAKASQGDAAAPVPDTRDGPRPASRAETPDLATVAAPAPTAANSTSAAPAAALSPSFDIVRVEPNGDSVVAARAKAGSSVVLLDQGRPIAEARADDNGQVAFVPPALAPGDHSLMLSSGSADGPALSSQSVAVSVPQGAKAGAPLVALLQPDQPTKLLSGPAPSSPSPPPVSVGTVDVEEMGGVFATGHATPGSQCRVYLNGSFVANVTAGSDGAWSLKIQHGMRPGHYSVRVDELASAAGDVRARAEVPFDYPAGPATSLSLLRPRKGDAALPIPPAGEAVPPKVGAVSPGGQPVALLQAQPGAAAPPATASDATQAPADGATVPGAPAAGVPTVVAQLLTTKVIHGDSLWRISRKMLGHGRRYTQIYAANTSQIRDPRLIYPGQIFVMPQGAP